MTRSRTRRPAVAASMLIALAAPAAAVAGTGAGDEGETLACAPDERVITVDGHGDVTARPDSLRVRVAAESQAETLEQAQAETNERAQRVIAALEALRIPELTLRTEAIEFFPVYAPQTPESAEPPRVVAYRARNAVLVTVEGVGPEALGGLASRVVDAAQKAGAVELGSIELFLEDEAGARDRALAAAIDDAERKANALARAAGLRVLAVQSIEASQEPCAIPFATRAAESAMADAPATPVETGELTIDANVVARFRFEEAPASSATP